MWRRHHGTRFLRGVAAVAPCDRDYDETATTATTAMTTTTTRTRPRAAALCVGGRGTRSCKRALRCADALMRSHGSALMCTSQQSTGPRMQSMRAGLSTSHLVHTVHLERVSLFASPRDAQSSHWSSEQSACVLSVLCLCGPCVCAWIMCVDRRGRVLSL